MLCNVLRASGSVKLAPGALQTRLLLLLLVVVVVVVVAVAVAAAAAAAAANYCVCPVYGQAQTFVPRCPG